MENTTLSPSAVRTIPVSADTRSMVPVFARRFPAAAVRDILRMVHPKAKNAEQEALWGYVCGKDVDAEALPECVRET